MLDKQQCHNGVSVTPPSKSGGSKQAINQSQQPRHTQRLNPLLGNQVRFQPQPPRPCLLKHGRKLTRREALLQGLKPIERSGKPRVEQERPPQRPPPSNLALSSPHRRRVARSRSTHAAHHYTFGFPLIFSSFTKYFCEWVRTCATVLVPTYRAISCTLPCPKSLAA
jgi:hypothetical protein